MLNQERYQAILNMINDKNAVSVTELAELLGASESTIRRDLTELDKKGLLKKVFGGATSLARHRGIFEDSVTAREAMMAEEKTEIGKYAATLINDNDLVYIDAGTTTARMIDFIGNQQATYVTNGIFHARKLLQKGLNAYIICGNVRGITEAVVGGEALTGIRSFNFSKAFMGTNGIDGQAGFTTPDIEEAVVKEAAVNNSLHAYILADHTKFNKVFSVTFAPVSKCPIITDRLPDIKMDLDAIVKEVMR